jgi:hypothetical protein
MIANWRAGSHLIGWLADLFDRAPSDPIAGIALGAIIGIAVAALLALFVAVVHWIDGSPPGENFGRVSSEYAQLAWPVD